MENDREVPVLPRGGDNHQTAACLEALIANFEAAAVGSDQDDEDDAFVQGRRHAFSEAVRVCRTLLTVANATKGGVR